MSFLLDSEWHPIDGFPSYEVSRSGLVRRTADGRWGSHAKAGDPIKARFDGRYLTVGLSDRQGRRYTCTVHRLVALAFVKGVGPQVNHKDGNKINNHASNLEWCTALQNVRHAVASGLAARGERCAQSKLSVAEASEIRRRWTPQRSGKKRDNSQRALAEEFGVTQRAIYSVIHNETWVPA